VSPSERAAPPAGEASDGPKSRLIEAALQTLKSKGYAGASAREIASAGGFNQALIFYHFGSVQKLLLAALDFVSERRMRSYGPRFERACSVSELAALAREIYAEDLQNGYVTVLGEMVAGGVGNAGLGSEVVARIQPWVEMVEHKLRELLAGSLLEAIVPPRDVAFAIIALYLGIDMLSQLSGDHARAEALLDLGVRYAPLSEAVVPRPGGGGDRDRR
jgi:AcrR family transcriptional regulator